MKLINLIIVFVFIFSCKKNDIKTTKDIDFKIINKNLSKIKYIKTKYILINDSNLFVADSRYYHLKNKKYPIEEITKYDSLGNPIEFQHGSAEGFIIYQKTHRQNESLPFEPTMYKYHIKIDKSFNYLIDNNDTIKNLNFLKNERKIITKFNSENRFTVYEY